MSTLIKSILSIFCSTVMLSGHAQDKPDAPQSFGYKTSWLAIKTSDVNLVAQSLMLKNVQSANWQRGIKASYDGRVFVSPPVKGWVLVVSTAFPDTGDSRSADRISPILLDLARKFPDLQFFASQRVAEYYAWAKFGNGKPVRKYAFVGESGETPWNTGALSKEETQLGLIFGPDHDEMPNEESVMKIAGAWSINPQELESMALPVSLGLLGSFAK